MTEVQELVARLRLKDEMSGPIRKVRAGISGVADALNSPRMQRGIQQIGTGLRRAAIIGGIGIGFLASQVAVGLQSLVELEQQQAQTNAVIASTGGVAGITGEEVTKLAEKYEALNATIGDETIRAGENMLLTFTNIREDAFEPALAAVLDMNTAMGKGPEGLTSTAILVGKALNDPAKGLTALRRVGVAFTKDQEKRIKKLQEEGKLYEAQTIILAELNKEFGGSFIAQGDTTAGKVAKFRDSIEDLQRTLATALLPTVGKIADKLSEFLSDPAIIAGVEKLGVSIAGLFSDKNLSAAGDIFKAVFTAAKDAAPTIAAAAKITGDVVKTAVTMFRSLPPEIQKLAIGAFAINKLTGGLVTNIAGGLISSVLKQLVSGVVNVQGAVVNVTGAAGVGGGVAPVGKPGAAGTLATAAKFLPLVLTGALLAGAAEVVAPIFREALDLPEGGLPENTVVQRGPLLVGSDAAQARARMGAPPDSTFIKKVGGPLSQMVGGIDEIVRNTASSERKEAIVNQTAMLHEANRLSHDQLKAFRDGKLEQSDLASIPRLLQFYGSATRINEQSIATDIASLKNLESIALERGDTVTAAKIAAAIVQLTATQKAAEIAAAEKVARASRAAGQQAAFAIRDKELSIVNNITVPVRVSLRETIKTQTTFKQYYKTAS